MYQPSEKVFIVCTGSSLAGFDFERLRDKNVIAVNHAIMAVPQADALVCIDFLIWPYKDERARAKIGNTPIIVDTEIKDTNGYNVQVMQRSRFNGFEFRHNRVATGTNSGYMAINVAYHLGARNIYLLGMDMGRIDGERYFDRPNFVEPKGMHPDYLHTLQLFDSMYMMTSGRVNIYNCSLRSHLEVFPKINFDDIKFD